MAKVARNILELIGDTPLVKLNRVVSDGMAEIWAKVECFNPLSSIKDRIAFNLIESAEKEGKICPGCTLVEPTSGNTGIGLAYVAAVKGYHLVLTLPNSMSIERRKILKAFGAEIVITSSMQDAVTKAQELAKENGWYLLQQFENPDNPSTHRKTTALEILKQMPDLDGFVSAVGTGGTITGVGEVLKKKATNPVHIVAVEPEESPVLSEKKPQSHKIQGISPGFIPKILNTHIYDEIMLVSYEEAADMTRRLAREEGLFVGISSGAAVVAALRLAKRMELQKKIVVILPDSGERYLSTDLFDPIVDQQE